ncbi:T9SS type A sorting domain-containing protein [Pontibacter anaerobius]|uniref:T9SS type A sorting domain-containing protein n=1 Tax=Pontibacter anaerobius TaxID=2993940 RepID=A0ABT3RIS8_9BACT|nr:T9SS type A sorting domain-containing protein [Pontibacter anaerobius]MCX2741408.1 T9SS type A sorting domain-containing protein [Pontibacter anaerobius]
MKKYFTSILFLFCLLAFGFIPFATLAQDDEPVECNYTDGDCISIGYVNIEFVEGNPDKYFISVDYNIIQGGENNCPAIERIRFEPSFGNTGIIEIGDEEEIFGSAVIEVNANSFDAQGGVLTMTVEYEEPGQQNLPIDLELPEDAECGEITPLPVELSRFEGKAAQSGVSLEWETASEQNNSHFEVERSTDGKAFEHLGKVAGNGNSSVALSYKYFDKHPFPGLNYYRLKQVDFDGRYEYSKVVAVTAAEAKPLQVQMLPNPCLNGDCQLNITSTAPGQQVRVQLQDLTGRVVFEQTMREDDEQLQLTQQQLKNLRGIFILSAEVGQEVVRQRVVLE